ncbi:PLP-dependent aminotransferase family protein [Roseomonas xinghualingensis]|uniref:aminotransferase-like domain-containing protein n=1 Tax=Roseomonas xinghualingensis TaxID=2986475 RepID=UPI0021F21999|nr:PLP-dependent aminotransferase family protein [Roseomonas sp. SXEYE001]MCV4206132.1 PLP-dependent aminotransferase family protein [Roseomonas sp. SXEYE001]
MTRPSKASAIVERLAASIEAGALRPGERVASVRDAAREHGVSKNTMAGAYDRLVASGHLEARRGAGYFVAAGARPAVRRAGPEVEEALDLVSLLREQGEAHYAVRPGDGRPPPGWMEESELGVHFARAARLGGRGEAHEYGSAWGYAPLRERIALSLQERAIACTPEQVLLTQGANHALDLIIRQMIEPDDAVLVDDPGYYPLFGKLRLARARIIGVRRLPDGPDLEDLAAKLALVRPKLFFTQSLAHNPTGGTLSPAVAHGLLQLAERHGFQIVEDDAFADLMPASAPRLAALDGLRRVLHVGTFSKTLSASLRVGFVAASPPIAQALGHMKLLTVVATSQYAERMVAGLIAGGHYLRHLRRLRARVERATDAALRDLASVGLAAPRPPGGGFYLWAPLPEGIEEAGLVREAAARSIFLAPGAVFSPEREGSRPMLRIHVAHASDPRFLDFMRGRLAGG